MNGDLSLSQTLGGLRIANPDDNDVNPVGNSTAPAAAAASAPAAPAAIDTSAGLDVTASLGFDPTAYTFEHQPALSPTNASAPVTRRPSQRQAPAGPTPGAPPTHHSSDRAYYSSTSPRSQQYPSRQQAQMASSPAAAAAYPKASYASRPSANTPHANLARSQSEAAAAAAMSAMSPPAAQRTPSGRSYPSASSAAQSPVGLAGSNTNYPPRRSSRPSPSANDSYGLGRAASQPSSHHSTPVDPQPLASASAEEWKDKGAAIGVTRSVDKSGATTSKIVKKGVKDFSFGRTLGEGSYSTVLAATDRQTAREYAIKVLDKRHIIKEKKVKYVNIEKDTLNRLTDHPGIVRLYYTFQDERSLYFVLDLATGGELLGVLKKTTSFDEECSRFYSAQILDAVEYMHTKGIIHRDLKPENVLLDDAGHVKITDFGTAKILDVPVPPPNPPSGSAFGQVSVSNDPLDGADQDRAVSFVGTAEYVSPELLTDKNACKASDLWAFGCIVYQLIVGRPPFKAANEYQTFQKIVNLDYSFPDGFPPAARDLVEKLLVLDPADRLPIAGIKRHPFFHSVEWGKGLWKQKPPRLRPHNPYRKPEHSSSRHHLHSQDSSKPSSVSKATSSSKPSISTPASSTQGGLRPQPRLITELAPPSQLDIDWSPVLNRPNERILKLGNLVVYSMPAPHSPLSRNGGAPDTPAEAPSKFSRLFGASATKKRQRLVMVSSAARLILAPSGGQKKEAKQMIDMRDRDVVLKSQQDAKGYTVWSVQTRDRHLTFEDTNANTGDAGSSVRSTQEWLDVIEGAREYAASQGAATPYSPEQGFNGMSPATPSAESDGGLPGDASGGPLSQPHRNILRRGPASDDDSLKGRKRFSKRHSKNGLAAVF